MFAVDQKKDCLQTLERVIIEKSFNSDMNNPTKILIKFSLYNL